MDNKMSGFDQQKEEQGMYIFLSNANLFLLLDCLSEAHKFATLFNLDNEQVNEHYQIMHQNNFCVTKWW